jgi:hypothetical protein
LIQLEFDPNLSLHATSRNPIADGGEKELDQPNWWFEMSLSSGTMFWRYTVRNALHALWE